MIAAGTFREDLYYRLAEIVVRIPSLAERHGDAALLAKHFLARFAREMNPQVKGFAPGALAAIEQLALARQRPRAREPAEARRDHGRGQADHRRGSRPAGAGRGSAAGQPQGGARGGRPRASIRKALAQTDDNISSAAKLLGISRPTLYDLLKQYGLQP